MKRLLLGIFTVIFAVTSASLVNAAEPANLSSAQIEKIRANCDTAQVSLQQLQQSDVATRLSRGRDYEQLLKLMAIFNSRVALNKLDAAALTAATADFEKRFRTFQRDYVNYSEHLSSTISMRCSEQPVTFYDSLVAVRENRNELAAEIDGMDSLLNRYQQSLDALAASVAASEREVAQ